MYLSVIIPVYNEEHSIKESLKSITRFFDIHNINGEIIITDDASNDLSVEIIKKIMINDERIRLFIMSENTGKFGALIVGMRMARGDIIVSLDADLQNDPEDILPLIQTIKNGADAAFGWRKFRKDSFFKILISFCANHFANLLFKSNFHDMNTGFRALNKHANSYAFVYYQTQRFLPHFLFLNGYKVMEVPVAHKKREGGYSHFGFWNRIFSVKDLLIVKFGKLNEYVPPAYTAEEAK